MIGFFKKRGASGGMDLKFAFSTAASHLRAPLQAAESLSGSPFDGIEINGEQLEFLCAPGFEGKIQPGVFAVRNFFDRSVTSNLGGAEDSMKRHFVESISLRLDRVEEVFGSCISSLIIDFAPEPSASSEGFGEKGCAAVKAVLAELYRRKMGLLIPCKCSLFKNGADAGAFYSGFLGGLILPNAALSLDFHPHELCGNADIEKLLLPFRMTAVQICLSYEPEAGNILVPGLLQLWCDAMRKVFVSETTLTFRPSISSEGALQAELERLNGLLKEVKK